MKDVWAEQCDMIAENMKGRIGQLVGVAVDDMGKAEAYEKYWSDKHPHIEVIKKIPATRFSPYVMVQIRLAGQLQ